ncbi:hypothetical protein [Hymenobacter sp. PAMC 26628]|uniref:hypothetical protein n=1 Tax=Hymenobacter sp. PAMC 26628 TaxID=1484118 RepID=UPI0007700F59|nr:hypothetical protein [Hymenobacter sp. PAMC 26628]AMJ65469.1 hypothetical protein AXW84_08540 [Hymenobacter sp. PAMC 26628]
MLYHCLLAPFADAAQQAQYEAVRAALAAAAAAGGPTTLLLGNLAALPGGLAIDLDALVLRPYQATALVLVPQNGSLRVPALAHGAWQLNSQPLASRGGADNPYAHYWQQQAAVAGWLGAELGQEPPPLAGAAVFAMPVTFGNEAEEHLRQTAGDFQLVRGPAQLPRRLQTARAAARTLDAEALEALAQRWQAAFGAEDESNSPEQFDATPGAPAGFWAQQARQLWQWLGAADVPADPPYGDATAAALAQHEQLRRELLAELHQHRQAAARHQAAHEQEFAQLRAQLARPAAPTPSERPEQATQAAARNQALDERIQQLGYLIEQLRVQVAAPAARPSVAALPATHRAGASSPKAYRPARGPWQLPVQPRVAARAAARLVAGLAVAAGLGVGGWSLLHGWGPVRVRAPQLAQLAPVPFIGPTDNSDEAGFADSTQTQEFLAPDVIPATDTETAVLREAPPASEAAREAPAAPDSVLAIPVAPPVADSLGPR